MKRALSARPELIAITLVVASWGYMLTEAMAARRLSCCTPHPTLGEDALAWLGMTLAMMVPTRIASVRDVARRSYRTRRLRAVTGYLFGYLAWWCLLGAAVVVVRRFSFLHEPRTATLLCVVGAVWVLLPVRERWFRACHRRIPLCPVGWRADLDALRQGLVNGAPACSCAGR